VLPPTLDVVAFVMYEALHVGELAVLGVFFDPESSAAPNAEVGPFRCRYTCASELVSICKVPSGELE